MEIKDDLQFDTGLALGLSSCGGRRVVISKPSNNLYRQPLNSSAVEPSLTLSLSDNSTAAAKRATAACRPARLSSPHSTVSSLSTTNMIKKEKDLDAGGGEEEEVERGSSRENDEDEAGRMRKKLRLTKEQSALLEDRFKEHSTLNTKQKQVLAKQLNLRPRQIEVWFQNRRARTKLKQTELDYELLKKCCETLSEENRRLQKELKEIKSLKSTLLLPSSPALPLFMQLPPTTVTLCPSCEKITGATAGAAINKPAATAAATMPLPRRHLFNRFTGSAAC